MALALTEDRPPPTFAAIGAAVGISASEAHAAVQRLLRARLLDADRRVNRPALLDFIFHGMRHAFPASVGGPALGVPTGAAAPGFDELDLPTPEPAPWVWPTGHGTVRGLALEPLYPSVPVVAPDRPALYKLLALIDLLRAGRAREVDIARRRIRQLIGDRTEAQHVSAVDAGSPRALRDMFTDRKLSYSIAKWIREPSAEILVAHPLAKQVLVEYREDLAALLAALVPSGDWAPAGAYHVVAEKGDGKARDLVFPGLVDAIVAKRVIDELEPAIREGDGDRVFCGRTHASSQRVPGDYEGWWAEWSRYLAELASASRENGFAYVFQTDVHEFFPTIDHATARESLAQRTGAHPTVVNLLFGCLQTWLPRFMFSRASGLPIEPHDVSRLIAHCLLKSVDDLFEDGYDLTYRRFVDDTVIFVRTRPDAESVQERHRQTLAALGLRANHTKTFIAPIDEYEASRHAHVFKEIDEAVQSRSATDLERIARRWNRRRSQLKGSSEGTESIRVARRLYTCCEWRCSDVMKERALDDAADPRLRDHALRYLRTRTLGPDEVLSLQGLYDRTSWPGARIGLARTIAATPLAIGDRAGVGLADWVADRVMRHDVQHGGGYARGLLLLAVYKHGERAHRDQIMKWASPAWLVDPYLRLFFVYVFEAKGEMPPSLSAILRHGGGEDFALVIRLCDDARNGRLRHLDRVLSACRERGRDGRWVIAPERLPFIEIVARSANDTQVSASWRDTVTSWLTKTLEPERSPMDPAVRRLLGRHMEGLRA